MAVFKVDIEKLVNNEYWTNVYYVEASDIDDAVLKAGDIVDIEKAVHAGAITFTKYRVAPEPNPGNAFVTVPDGGTGTQSSDQALPLFNVVRVDFGTGVGRPDRKFLRTPITEGTQNGGTLEASYRGLIEDNYAEPLLALGFVVSKNGDAWETRAVYPRIAERQLRRGSKRRITPVLP